VIKKRRGPDFIIGGAPRSGTTWLSHLLDRHPAICMAKPFKPEPKYFLVDDEYERGFDYYVEKWFSKIPPEMIAGEKSTNYLERAVAAERMHKHIPDVKLIFILREPVARAFSNYLWSRMNGLEKEDFRTALELEDRRESEAAGKARYSRPHAYFSRGLYADLLAPYYGLFGRERILCLRFEDIDNGAGDIAARAHRFLGVQPRYQDAEELHAINESVKDGQTLTDDVSEMLKEKYAEPNARLAELLGQEFEIW
jgi:hypothetical protein